MAKFASAFPSPYLKSADIGDPGGDTANATIVRVTQEELRGDLINVAYFAENLATGGKNKGMILNTGNSNMVMKLSGCDDTDDVKDIPVLIYVENTTKGDGSPTTGLRLRKGVARSAAAQSAVDVTDDAFSGDGA